MDEKIIGVKGLSGLDSFNFLGLLKKANLGQLVVMQSNLLSEIKKRGGVS